MNKTFPPKIHIQIQSWFCKQKTEDSNRNNDIYEGLMLSKAVLVDENCAHLADKNDSILRWSVALLTYDDMSVKRKVFLCYISWTRWLLKLKLFPSDVVVTIATFYCVVQSCTETKANKFQVCLGIVHASRTVPQHITILLQSFILESLEYPRYLVTFSASGRPSVN